MEPVIALCALTLFVWAVAIVATFDEESEDIDLKTPKTRRLDDTEERKAA